MSIASPLRSGHAPHRTVASLRRVAIQSVKAVGFWTAVLVPLAYPALLVGGLGGQQLLFGVLLAANVLGLVLGHDYRRE